MTSLTSSNLKRDISQYPGIWLEVFRPDSDITLLQQGPIGQIQRSICLELRSVSAKPFGNDLVQCVIIRDVAKDLTKGVGQGPREL